MRAAPLQARIKQLATTKAHHGPYIERLPATPTQLLAMYPTIAHRVFSRTQLPLGCPLRKDDIQAMRAKIKVRGGGGDNSSTAIANGGITMQGAHANMTAWFLYFALLEACGYYRLLISIFLLACTCSAKFKCACACTQECYSRPCQWLADLTAAFP